MDASDLKPSDEAPKKSFLERMKDTARSLRDDLESLALAARDSRTPWYAKAVALATVAYALSPIDLIPDFIPVLGYLDDLLLLPAGIALAIRLIPREALDDARDEIARKRLRNDDVSGGGDDGGDISR